MAFQYYFLAVPIFVDTHFFGIPGPRPSCVNTHFFQIKNILIYSNGPLSYCIQLHQYVLWWVVVRFLRQLQKSKLKFVPFLS